MRAGSIRRGMWDGRSNCLPPMRGGMAGGDGNQVSWRWGATAKHAATCDRCWPGCKGDLTNVPGTGTGQVLFCSGWRVANRALLGCWLLAKSTRPRLDGPGDCHKDKKKGACCATAALDKQAGSKIWILGGRALSGVVDVMCEMQRGPRAKPKGDLPLSGLQGPRRL